MRHASYDYVVIGSGAGGGPVAANLARAGYSVLVLEAGGDCNNYNYRVPCFHPLASEDPAMSWDYFVHHYDNDARQQQDTKYVAEQDGVLYPRAGTLGGCTAHNAMITVYPHNSDWDHIAELTGDASWTSDNMRKYFRRVERCGYVPKFKLLLDAIAGLFTRGTLNPSRHGFSGWLSTEAADPGLVFKDRALLKLVASAAANALFADLGNPAVDFETHFDPNDWRALSSRKREGVCLTPLATKNGCRNGTRELLLAAQDRFGLEIETDALATRIVLDDEKRAVAVEFTIGKALYGASRATKSDDTAPNAQRVAVSREVILCAGAFNSPQLLMLSGIGPAERLARLGIDVRVDLPGVGQNLQDRYEVGVVSQMDRPFTLLSGASFMPPAEGAAPDAAFSEWLRGKGVYTCNGAAIAVMKRSDPSKADPDLFIFGLPTYFKGYYPGYSGSLKHCQDMFTWAILKAHTVNTAGEVALTTSDPRVAPAIRFRYFDEGSDSAGEDLQAVVEGVLFAREINKRLIGVGMTEVWPGPIVSTREQVAEFIKNEAWGHHASCTNKIGADGDKMAVLDSRFRVRGTTGLRVVDASVFPRIPGFFIVSAIYMIAEKASEDILAAARGDNRAQATAATSAASVPHTLRS